MTASLNYLISWISFSWFNPLIYLCSHLRITYHVRPFAGKENRNQCQFNGATLHPIAPAVYIRSISLNYAFWRYPYSQIYGYQVHLPFLTLLDFLTHVLIFKLVWTAD